MTLVLALLSALSFTYYGVSCIAVPRIRAEYVRYGIPHLAVLSGLLQLWGAAGVVIGLVVPALGAIAAACLSVMMILGVGVRIRLRDPLDLMLPAAGLAVVNAVLFGFFLADVVG